MEFNWFTRAIARVVLASYVTHLLAPVVHACEVETLPRRLWGQQRDQSPLREAALQRSLQQSLGFKPRVEPLKPSSDSVGLPLDPEQARLQSEAYQYRLRIKTLSSKKEKFQLKLSCKEKGSDSSFERLHTDTIRQGKLNSIHSKAQEVQNDALLNLFKRAPVHKFTTNNDTICYSWDIGDNATLKIARDGSVFFDQGSSPLLSAYDLVLKTTGELFLQSLSVASLTLQSPTHIIGSVVADCLHIDRMEHDQTVINEGGLQVKQLTGQGTLVNYATLNLEGTTENPALIGVHHLINKKKKDSFKEPKIESSHLRITTENMLFFNGVGAAFKVADKLTADPFSMRDSVSFINKGNIYFGEAALNRKASNAGFWQTHQMIIKKGDFTNRGFGTLNILDQLTITSEFMNEGILTMNWLQVSKK